MPAFGTVKRDLAALMGQIVREGVIDSAANGTFVDAALTEPDDFYNDLNVYVFTGTGIGQERRITDWVQSTNTASITGNWATNPVAGDRYFICRREWNNPALDGALLQSLRILRRNLLLPKEDTSVTFGAPGLAASYTRTLPSGFVSVANVLREGETTDIYDLELPGPKSPAPWWYLSRSGTTFNLIFDKPAHDAFGFMVEDRKLKIIGQQYQAEPSSDASSIDVNPGPIVSLAAALLRLGSATNPELVSALARTFQGVARNLQGGIWAHAVVVEES